MGSCWQDADRVKSSVGSNWRIIQDSGEDKIVRSVHYTNDDGNPCGGYVEGTGLKIQWQNGPMKDIDGMLLKKNGAFVEDVIEAALGRLRYFQGTRFANRYNESVIIALESALAHLNDRTKDREERGVEGTYEE